MTWIGKVCWNIYCYCHDMADEVPQLSSDDILLSLATRDGRCPPGQCGLAEVCDADDLQGQSRCQALNCPCALDDLVSVREAAEAAGEVMIGSAADQSYYACQPEECGWVERCKEAGGARLCWAMHCVHEGCKSPQAP